VTLQTSPTTLNVLNPQGCPKDMVATAALIAGLDLLVTVDTMVAHLAGALGTPAWLLLKQDADWRWLRGRADSPWYPSMRLYRQTVAGDWLGVVAAVQQDLHMTSV
jgi:ADP-heptose:LPS heptosyltransferase